MNEKDASDRYVGNVVIGALLTENAGTPILLNTDILEKVNQITLTCLCSALGVL